MLKQSKSFVFDFVVTFIIIVCCAGDKGPFLVVPGEFTSCMTTVFKDPMIVVELRSYKRNGQTLLNGSIEFKKDFKDIRVFISFFQIYPDKKKLYDIRDLKCDNIFTNMIINTILGTRYFKKTCNFKAGVYNFSNFDLDKVFHQIAVYVLPFGKYNTQMKYKHEGLQLVCLNFPISIEPLPDN